MLSYEGVKRNYRKLNYSSRKSAKTITDTCVHFWLVDGLDIGRCRKCHAVKDFRALQTQARQGGYRGRPYIKTTTL